MSAVLAGIRRVRSWCAFPAGALRRRPAGDTLRKRAIASCALLAAMANAAAGTPPAPSGEPSWFASIPQWLVAPPIPAPTPAVSPQPHVPGFLDALRESFVLDHAVDRRRVRAQIDWVRRHPEFLARVGPRIQRHLPGICEAVRKRGLPGELCLLPVIESALDPMARSGSGAVGLWQFIPGTARRYGLRIDWWIDERRDPLAATNAALRYLTDLHVRFGDWLLAVAAYNCGEGQVARALQTAPDDAAFFELRLPRETLAYVPRLLAFAAIFRDPEAHGITLPGRLGRNETLDTPYAPVPTGGQMDLSRAALATGLTLAELHRLNPALKRWATPPRGPDRLLLPAERAPVLAAALAAVPESERVGWLRHRIARHETLGHIAQRYHVDVAALMEANGLRNSLIREGRFLLVPKAGSAPDRPQAGLPRQRAANVYVVQAGDSLWAISRRMGIPLDTLMQTNRVGAEEILRVGRRLRLADRPDERGSAAQREVRYRVRPGDSLGRIAQEFDVSVDDVAAWNAIDPEAFIFPGQELVLFVRPAASSPG